MKQGMSRRAVLALAAFTGIVGVTVAWWALALWPDAGMPAWVQRTRAVCFGVPPGGLPNAAGWLSLIGEPLGMLAFLFIGWGREVREAFGALRGSLAGRFTLGAASALLFAGLLLVTGRVRDAGATFSTVQDASAFTRLHAPAPPLELLDHQGRAVRLADFAGRPVVLTFAYAHCETVCPSVVQELSRAVGAAAAQKVKAPVLLVVTLDPWRDTPSRLAHLHDAWHLPANARVLGGDTSAVTRVLDAWKVVRTRDPATGEVAHQPVTWVLDRDGRIAFRLGGNSDGLREMLERL